eukprot:scaffold1736_cov67-Phaeocystis_antarctica.AAC.2
MSRRDATAHSRCMPYPAFAESHFESCDHERGTTLRATLALPCVCGFLLERMKQRLTKDKIMPDRSGH